MLSKLFSYTGTYTRWQYFIYGIILPLLLMVILGAVSAKVIPNIGESKFILYLMIIPLVFLLHLFLSSSIKRVRDMQDTVFLTSVLLLLILPLGIIFLLISPAKKEKVSK